MNQCTKHFHACDCRERLFQKLSIENEIMRKALETISRDSDYPPSEAYSKVTLEIIKDLENTRKRE